MHKIIRRSIEVFFGQISNVICRQHDFTIQNLSNLLKTIRKGFAETCRYNKLQPKNSRMSLNCLVVEFVRELFYGFIIFLSSTKFGSWFSAYTSRKLNWRKTTLMRVPIFCIASCILWRYLTNKNYSFNNCLKFTNSKLENLHESSLTPVKFFMLPSSTVVTHGVDI